MAKILGLDIGTNSIGWALIKKDDKNKKRGNTWIGQQDYYTWY